MAERTAYSKMTESLNGDSATSRAIPFGPMNLSGFLMTTGKSALFLAAVGLGLAKAIRIGRADPKMEAIHGILRRLESRVDAVESLVPNLVNRKQLDEAVVHAFLPLSNDVDRRLHQQAQTTDELKIMLATTDKLLERLLEQLEGAESSAAGDQKTIERHSGPYQDFQAGRWGEAAPA